MTTSSFVWCYKNIPNVSWYYFANGFQHDTIAHQRGNDIEFRRPISCYSAAHLCTQKIITRYYSRINNRKQAKYLTKKYNNNSNMDHETLVQPATNVILTFVFPFSPNNNSYKPCKGVEISIKYFCVFIKH